MRKPDEDVLMVLTGKSLKTMAREGGSGNWRANEGSLRGCRWIIGVRNRHADWSELDHEHRQAFFIGEIAGVSQSSEEPGRWVVEFERYADLKIPDFWPANHRNPVAYARLHELPVDVSELAWKRFRTSVTEQREMRAEASKSIAPASVFSAAKVMIANALSIKPDAIEINIRL